jgi:predicted RNA-binding Zn-ribbon protein involved in translation (DUF1610 family)
LILKPAGGLADHPPIGKTDPLREVPEMTTIKATCPDCGEISLTPEDMELRVVPGDDAASSYTFVCPDCGDRVRKPADERIVRLLISGGVPVVEGERNVEGPAPRFPFPALTHDDLLDFHTLIERADWFDVLLEVERRHRVG